MCPCGSDGSASFSHAQRALVVVAVVCAVAMWLAVFFVEVLDLCFDPLSCVRKWPAVHFHPLFLWVARGGGALLSCFGMWCVLLWPSW